MAFTCSVAQDRQLAIVRCGGVVDGATVVEMVRCVAEHPAWETGYDMYWDVRGTSELVLLPEDLKAFATVSVDVGRKIGPGRTAVVVSRQLDESIARLLVHIAKIPRRKRGVFWSIEDAIAFLGKSLPSG